MARLAKLTRPTVRDLFPISSMRQATLLDATTGVFWNRTNQVPARTRFQAPTAALAGRPEAADGVEGAIAELGGPARHGTEHRCSFGGAVELGVRGLTSSVSTEHSL
jgi:hypothetical protein